MAADKPALLMGCGLSTIIGTISILTVPIFGYYCVAAGVGAAYHPDADFGRTFLTLKIAMAIPAVAVLSAIVLAILHRFGRYPTAPVVLGSACFLWVAIAGYHVVTQKPRPPYFAREFQGAVYRVRWEDANLGLETPYGTTRQRVSTLSYRTCLRPIAVGTDLSQCRQHGFISIGQVKDARRDIEYAEEVFDALSRRRNEQGGPVISVDPLYVDHRFKAEMERQLTEQSSTSTGSSSTSSGGSTSQTRTYGSVQMLRDTKGAYGFQQINPDGGSARYYFWRSAGSQSQVSHWAVCSVFRESDGGALCRHSEVSGRNYYRYSVPEDRNDEWQSLRDALLSKVANQRVSNRR